MNRFLLLETTKLHVSNHDEGWAKVCDAYVALWYNDVTLSSQIGGPQEQSSY